MKTVYTVLPIYDALNKQCYQRAKHGGYDQPVPVITSRFRLPSFQWLDTSDGVANITGIEMINTEGSSTDIYDYFPTIPSGVTYDSDEYFMYNGDTLKYLLDPGIYYLKITTDTDGIIYYSDWFLVDCVYDNLIAGFTNFDYEEPFESSGTAITSAVNSAGNGNAYSSNTFKIIKGHTYRLVFYATLNSGMVLPDLSLFYLVALTNIVTMVEGLNDITFTATGSADAAYLLIESDEDVDFSTTEMLLMNNYSDKYLTIQFSHSCNLGDIVYEDDFEQVLYLESETMEPIFPYTEKGQENGYGQFVPTWQRQDKVYIIRTKLIPQFIVDVLHRLKLHDTITLIDIVGDAFTVEEIEVEHEWQYTDKYYALATITVNLGEGIVITGCCTAINECN